jgi:hypothetical protein
MSLAERIVVGCERMAQAGASLEQIEAHFAREMDRLMAPYREAKHGA